MDQQIERRVIATIAKTQKIAPESINLDQLIEVVCEDSLDLINLLFELEDEFDINIPDESKELKTIRDIVLGVEKLIRAKQTNEIEICS